MGKTRILFICLHGSAKSVVAAAWMQRLAAERGLQVACASAGVEPWEEIPAAVDAGLLADGLKPLAPTPVPATREVIESADLVVTFGCEVTAQPRAWQRWDGVPHVSDGYVAARDAIRQRLDALLGELGDAP